MPDKDDLILIKTVKRGGDGAVAGFRTLNEKGGGVRFIVCGSRHWTDREFVWRKLDALHDKVGVTGIAEGSCKGVDRHARMWAKERGVPVQSFPADWEALGAKAGPMRNERMADEYKPDGVVAIGMGRGTDSMVRIARRKGIKVWEIERGPLQELI